MTRPAEIERTAAGAVAFWGGWAAIVVVPLYLVVGRALLGSDLGWLSVIVVVFSWIVVPALVLLPALTLFDPPVRRSRSARTVYSYASFTLWTGVFIFGIAIVDNSSDGGGAQSALMRWTRGAISADVSQSIADNAAWILTLAYLVTLAAAVLGIVQARRVAVRAAAVA